MSVDRNDTNLQYPFQNKNYDNEYIEFWICFIFHRVSIKLTDNTDAYNLA